MSRSRLTFFAIIGLAIVVVVVAIVLKSVQDTQQSVRATQAMSSTLAVVTTPGNANNNPINVAPVFAGNTVPTDALPTYTCAADAFASYYTLEQMQAAGYDVKNGFHLGIIPFLLDGQGGTYDISEDGRTNLLAAGKIDCLFTTLDSTALSGAGVITAVIDESAGADQLWVNSKIKTLNDLRGKKLIYADGSVSEFFALYTLFVAGLIPNTDVKMVPANSVDDAVKGFASGQADALSGWEPNVLAAGKAGGTELLASDKLHVLVDVIMTSRAAIKDKSPLVQAFHNAWFQTLKAQFEDFPTAAKQVASWGNNDWSGVSVAAAEKDWGTQLQHIAQAGLTQNSAVMKDTQRLVDRLDTAKVVWSSMGQTVYSGRSADLIDPDFVNASAARPDLSTSGAPHNTSFLLSSKPDFQQIDPKQGQTLAVLPCRKFDFAPESFDLNQDSERALDNCVIPVLSSSTGIYLQIVGSAAWPAPDDPTLTPAYTDKDILDVAMKRAQAVRDYLVKKGFDPKRFTVSARLPPEADRNTNDVDKQAQDRYVEMTLITVGR